jgi:hypothetical protein
MIIFNHKLLRWDRQLSTLLGGLAERYVEMLNIFQVGNREIHRVEIDQPFFGTTLSIKVDDKVVLKRKSKPFQLAFHVPFSLGLDEVHNVELHINYLTFKYEVYLDGQLFIPYLFPQVVGYNAFGLAVMAYIMATLSCLAILLTILSSRIPFTH